MKCQKCGANNANTHVKTIINGEFREYDLCSECAHKMGYTNVFADMENDFSGLLGAPIPQWLKKGIALLRDKTDGGGNFPDKE